MVFSFWSSFEAARMECDARLRKTKIRQRCNNCNYRALNSDKIIHVRYTYIVTFGARVLLDRRFCLVRFRIERNVKCS